MPMEIRETWQTIRNVGFLFLWIMTITWMWTNWARDPYNPALIGTQAYGHNGQGALREGFLWTLLELCVLYAIVRPWSFRRSIGRLVGALLLLGPWTVVTTVASMHAGGIMLIHSFWLVMVGAVLFGALIACFVSFRSEDDGASDG